MNEYIQGTYIPSRYENKADIKPYSSAVENELCFPYLFKTMDEYKNLDHNTKRKYMNKLTEWYMREKDALNIIDIDK